MRRMMPYAGSESEFGGLHGDCGPDDTLMGLHTLDPNRWPLTFAALAALNADEARRGYEAANGAQNITDMANYLSALGVAHQLIGYAQFNLATFHADLLTHAGLHFIAWETSTAGAGLPEDERGVLFHFAGIVGIDDQATMPDGHTGGYYRVDGDSSTDNASGLPTAPIPTSWQEIQASGPIAYIIILGLPTAGHVPAGWRDDGVTLTAPNGHTVVLGFRAYILADPNWPAVDQPQEEERHLSQTEWHNPALGSGQRQVFLRTVLRFNSAAEGVQRIDLGADLLALEAIEVRAVATDATTRAKLTAADAFVKSYSALG